MANIYLKADIFIHVFIKHILWIVVTGIRFLTTTWNSALWWLFGSLFIFQLLWDFYSWVIHWLMVGSTHNHFVPVDIAFENLRDWSSSAYLLIMGLFPSSWNKAGAPKKKKKVWFTFRPGLLVIWYRNKTNIASLQPYLNSFLKNEAT